MDVSKGLATELSHKNTMKKSEGFKWLKENAHKFGFSPYKYEPWHWEVLVPLQSFLTGAEFTKDYSVRVTEKTRQHDKVGKNITNIFSTDKKFGTTKGPPKCFLFPTGDNICSPAGTALAGAPSSPAEPADPGKSPDEQRQQAATWLAGTLAGRLYNTP